MMEKCQPGPPFEVKSKASKHRRPTPHARQVYKGYTQLRMTTRPGNATIATQRISQQPKLALVDEAGLPTVSRAAVR